MGELPFFFDGDALGWEEFVPVDRLVDACSAQAVETIQFDVGGKDVHGVVTIGNRDKEVKDISFIFFVPLGSSSLPFPLLIPLVSVFGPMLVGFFHASHIHLTLCQIITSLFEYFELFLVVTTNFLIFVHNLSQSMYNEEEFLPSWVPMTFESGMHGSGRELELTEFL